MNDTLDERLAEYNLVELLIYAAVKPLFDANALSIVTREAAQMVLHPTRTKAGYANMTPLEKRYCWR
jgi:hypothetical protein